MKKAKGPFRFYTRLHLRILTGEKADNLTELVKILKEVPGSVVYHHTHHFLQQHQYLSPEPPNDFAYWAREVLGEDKLSEMLSSIDTRDYSSIRSLRESIIEVIEAYIKEKPQGSLRTASPGEEFYFIRSQSFVFPTPYIARNLREFVKILRKISIDAIYFHVFEARLRLEKESNDFSFWIKDSVGDLELADAIARLDPYSRTMENLRESMVSLIEKRLK